VQPPGSAESSCFDAPYFPAAVARTAKALRNAALPLAREAFAATPTDPVLAGALMALQTAGKGANAARRALRTAAVRAFGRLDVLMYGADAFCLVFAEACSRCA
jgi:hypothetical protein